MTRTLHRLPRWQHALLIGVGAATLASGVAWLALHYGLGDGLSFGLGAGAGVDGAGVGGAPDAPGAGLPHPAEPWLMRIHGLASFGAVFVFGVLAAGHVPQGWRLVARHRWAHQRGSGLALCALAALLVASGYALYYFASETVRPTLGWVHAGLGVGMALVAMRHRRRRGAAHRERGDGPPTANERQSHSHRR